MTVLNGQRSFPCPICSDPCEVRITKKKKPYITCDPCGIQLFIRGPAGITAFNRLIERADQEGLWDRLREMDRRYLLKCPSCGCRFWIEPDLAKTSLFDGALQGFRCPTISRWYDLQANSNRVVNYGASSSWGIARMVALEGIR